MVEGMAVVRITQNVPEPRKQICMYSYTNTEGLKTIVRIFYDFESVKQAFLIVRFQNKIHVYTARAKRLLENTKHIFACV